jgi:Mg-chelatase subunit ChlD
MKRILKDVPKFHTLIHREARGLDYAMDDDHASMKWQDEMFDRLYAGPDAHHDLPETEQDKRLAPWAQRTTKAAEESPAFTQFAAACKGDLLASALAVQELTTALKPEQQRPEDPTAAKREPLPGTSALARARAGGTAEDRARRDVMVAVARAEKAVDEAKETLEGLFGVNGWGSDPALHGGEIDAARVAALLTLLRSAPQVKRIAEMAGRMKRIAENKRRTKTTHGVDEVTDIEQGANLARVLPSEMVKLTNPLLRRVFLRDLKDRNLMQYRLEGKEPKGKGPMVVLTDKSASMQGSKDEWATALSLALMNEAQRDGRTFAFLPFDTHVIQTLIIKAGTTLPESALLIPANGGTDIAAGLRSALDVIRTEAALGKADVILITDGESNTSEAAAIREAAKELHTNITAIGIGTAKAALRPWTDDVYAVASVSTLDDGLANALFETADDE